MMIILTADKVDPLLLSVAHKTHTTKVMFLSALARQRFINTTRQWFNGLIGIYPVGELDMYVQTSFIHRQGEPAVEEITLCHNNTLSSPHQNKKL
jgi:hypothetical protein